MKPTIQFNETSRRDFDDRDSRQGAALLQTDYNFQGTSLANMGGRCFGSRRPSFRAISQDYFKYEARQTYAGEAALFVVIVMTAAVPIIDSASALLQLVRSFGSI
jgi:hypothetical protein